MIGYYYCLNCKFYYYSLEFKRECGYIYKSFHLNGNRYLEDEWNKLLKLRAFL